jgi:hypothetical protein
MNALPDGRATARYALPDGRATARYALPDGRATAHYALPHGRATAPKSEKRFGLLPASSLQTLPIPVRQVRAGFVCGLTKVHQSSFR